MHCNVVTAGHTRRPVLPAQLELGLVRATQDGAISQTATFSVAMPSDETLSSLALASDARGSASVAKQARSSTVQISRRIGR